MIAHMARFGKKKKLTEYLYTKPGIAALLIITVFFTLSVVERFKVEREMARRTQEAEVQKARLIERKKELEERVEYLSGERGIEAEIRSHFDVTKEGEQVVIIVGEEEGATEEKPEAEVQKPWYQFW